MLRDLKTDTIMPCLTTDRQLRKRKREKCLTFFNYDFFLLIFFAILFQLFI